MVKKTGKTPVKRSAKKVNPKRTSKQPVAKTAIGPRRLKPPSRSKPFQRAKHLKNPIKLPNSWRLAKASANTLWQNRGLFIGITLIYGLLNLILGQGLSSSSDIASLKSELSKTFSGHIGSLGSSIGTFSSLVGSSGNGSSQTDEAYPLMLALITSLAVIWALRQIFSGTIIRIRDAFYKGMYPLVPFILVLLIIGLQLIPFLVGSALYSIVISNGIAVHFIEKFIWLAVFGILACLSFYMLSSSIFALYIVTLPDMTPLKALRSARELVRYRRWSVLRKILCLPIILFIVAAVIMVPVITLLSALGALVFFLLTMLALVAVHTYMYTLYRELLNEPS